MEKKKKTVSSRRSIILSLISIALGALLFIGYPLMNKYREANPIEKQCIIASAEVFNSSSGTGGIATSGTELKINTDGCGTVYVDHAIAPQKKSYQDMADELNQHQGQKITLIFPPFQLPGTRDSVLTGYGYRL